MRAQFTLVVFLLAFIPNAALTLSAGRSLGLFGGAVPLALWLLLVAVLSAAVGWILSATMLRPLLRLESELESATFDAQAPAGAHSDDPSEIVALRQAFSQLLRGLHTEQQRRGAFMATLVHDLKTPLIATGHLIRTLAHRPLPELERHALGDHLLTENQRLLGLVQQMADAHRYEREDVHLNRAPTDLNALMERVAARLQSQAELRGIRLTVAPQGHWDAEVDAAVLERALANLTDNALRYARRQVTLRAGPAGLSVLDDGPGLASSIESLAQPFNAQPVEIAGQHYTAGTAGLGLYIVRRVAEAHGGSLLYTREADQTVMTLHLPSAVPSAAPHTPSPSEHIPPEVHP